MSRIIFSFSLLALLSSTANATTAAGTIRSDFEPGELIELCVQAVAQTGTQFDSIAQITPEARTFDNTVLAFENANARFQEIVTPLIFMAYVSPNKITNTEAADCEVQVGDFGVKTLGRKDLYVALKDQTGRNSAEARLHQKTLEAFEANGLKLADDQLAQLTQLFSRLNKLQSTFSDNLNKDSTQIELNTEELDGVSLDFLARLKKSGDGSRLIVTTKATDYVHVMENAKKSETRKKMLLAYQNRQAETNTQLLEQALTIRQQIAQLMGRATWAEYQLKTGRMAKNPETVFEFLHGLKDKLSVKKQDDLNQLLEFKKSLDSSATSVEAWDIAYLGNQLKKRDYALDTELIKEYFPANHVIQAMFEIYSQILGVRYEEVSDTQTWSPDVKLYKITDQKSNHTIGYFYTDFVPRQDKYEHFAAFTLIGGRLMPDGYNQPISAIVGNFNPPANGKPALLRHEEVETLFHEFGHIMHQTLTRAPFASLSGSSTSRDFVEAPSQMLENWIWQESILNRISGHYLDSRQKLPKELLQKMLAAQNFQQGYFYTRQLLLALTDMTFHTATGPVDVTATFDRMYKEVIGIEPLAGGHFVAGWGHLMGGYDAGYYGYLWSEVYAQDMFTAFESTDLLNPEVGARYRQIILESGNMEDAQDLISRFLGRPSNNEAFLRKLGITK